MSTGCVKILQNNSHSFRQTVHLYSGVLYCKYWNNANCQAVLLSSSSSSLSLLLLCFLKFIAKEFPLTPENINQILISLLTTHTANLSGSLFCFSQHYRFVDHGLQSLDSHTRHSVSNEFCTLLSIKYLCRITFLWKTWTKKTLKQRAFLHAASRKGGYWKPTEQACLEKDTYQSAFCSVHKEQAAESSKIHWNARAFIGA